MDSEAEEMSLLIKNAEADSSDNGLEPVGCHIKNADFDAGII